MPSMVLAPGVFEEIFGALQVKAQEVVAAGLTTVGEEVVQETRSSFVGQHAYRTPTPARRGGPPSRISSTLSDSLVALPPESDGSSWQVKIGAQTGMTPWYGKIDSATYGYYLEFQGAGINHVTYPFLVPAFRRVATASRLVQAFSSLSWV